MIRPEELFNLKGKRAIVTGASRGLGAAAAEALAAAGVSLVLVGRDRSTLEEQAEALSGYGVPIHPIRCDVSRPKQITTAIARAQRLLGGVDILINNAGIITRRPAADYPEEDWRQVIETNLTGLFLFAQGVGRIMIEQGSGKIINIASLLSFSGGKFVPAYTASKHGVAGVTKALANEWASQGINVNAIAPGYFVTDATEAIRKDRKRKKELTARIPAGRWGDVGDLAGPILFLSSGASDYVHGHIMLVDGGFEAS
jgi:2-deoxy-D-gluconate 3-dehydrogenase